MLETISTLKFANRAKNIRNEARVNEDLDQKSLLRKYERELKKLRAELEERSKNVVDKRRLLELDEQVRNLLLSSVLSPLKNFVYICSCFVLSRLLLEFFISCFSPYPLYTFH